MTAGEINVAIGKRLAGRRRELGLSLAQVAQRCGVSLQQIHRYETGDTGLSVAMLVQLSRCLDAPLMSFLDAIEGALPETQSTD